MWNWIEDFCSFQNVLAHELGKNGTLFFHKLPQWNKDPKTKTTEPSDDYLHLQGIRETSLVTRREVKHFRVFSVVLAAGLVEMSSEYWTFQMPQIQKNRCNFILRWLIDLGNTSLEQNLRLKTLGYLRFIPASFCICCLFAQWPTFGLFKQRVSLTQCSSLHLGYQFLTESRSERGWVSTPNWVPSELCHSTRNCRKYSAKTYSQFFQNVDMPPIPSAGISWHFDSL